MTPWLVVAGALVGAPLRLLAERIAVARRGQGSVAGTLTVNVAGSAVLGLLLGSAAVPVWVTALVGVGFCGTLTTFSTFGTEVVRLVEGRARGRAVAYVVATVLLGLAAAAGGYLLGRVI
ncbi:CrcB family protein [Blastococcus sp. KM273128]|uniref:fluoride efflux transporter FluC n=1 Tax=Blastococcus sp. KM273128 TaxID=2570314 RepID=UPI001F4339B9|nr:CrcB family protein [Blastococcus sp. KM273128]MCF6743359.1 CrcB family protein [Blastococcus sp. KM273128]